jgi:hypothetical protein
MTLNKRKAKVGKLKLVIANEKDQGLPVNEQEITSST